MTVPIIFSSIFSSFPEITFGFSTRNGGASPEPYGLNVSFNVGDDESCVGENQQRFLSSLRIKDDEVAAPAQVHGATVRRVIRPGIYSNCDALITNQRGIYLCVTVADCLPIFLFDPSSDAIGAVHAGWRGCMHRIVSKTVEKMVREFSARIDTLHVYIGPSAHACCYEVGEDVASQFAEQFLVRKPEARIHLDMLAATRSALLAKGILGSHIEISTSCTICTPTLFHSYRRDGKHSGRMMGIIGLKRD